MSSAEVVEEAPVVALSFTGKHRALVRPIAEGLKTLYGPKAVFFDEWSRAEVSTTDGGWKLERKYKSAKLIAVFLSEDYGQLSARQRWTRLEWGVVYDRHHRGETDTIHLFSVGLTPDGLDGLNLPGLNASSALFTAIESHPPEVLVSDLVLRLEALGVHPAQAHAPPPAAVWTAYRRAVRERHGHVSMIGVHSDDFRFTISDVYVPLRFMPDLPRAQLDGQWHDLEARGGPVALGIEEVFHHVKASEVPTVMGEAGSGKTTALKKLLVLVLDQAEALGLPADIAPILVRAAELKSILEAAPAASAPSAGRGWLDGPLGSLVKASLPEAHRRVLLAAGRPVLVLLDGLDELADPDLRKRALAHLDEAVIADPDLRAVVSCRHSARGFGMRFPDRCKRFEVQPLDDDQRRELTRRWFVAAFREQRLRDPEARAELHTEALFDELGPVFKLDAHLRALVSTPLFATLQCVLHLAGRSLPNHSGDFLRYALELLIDRRHNLGVEHKPRDADAGSLIRVLEDVALVIQRKSRQDGLTRQEWAQTWGWAVGREIPDRNEAAWQNWLGRHLEAPDDPGRTLDQAAVHWLQLDADIIAELARDQLIFRHRGFQEGLAAARMVRHGEQGLQYLAQHADGQTWREPFLYAARLLGRDRFAELARPLLQRPDWPQLEDVLQETLDILGPVDPHPFIEVLHTGHDPARAAVARLFQNRPDDQRAALRQAADRVLDQVQDPTARQTLEAFVGRDRSPQEFIETLTKMRFLPVPGGTFNMGADDLGDVCRPTHSVTVSSFWLAETPVTNAQYRPFVEATGREPALWSNRQFNQDSQPVVAVTWEDAVAYCRWMTERLGRGWTARLPSEAWWERAARGDDGRPYPWGSAALTPELAWYGQDYNKDAPKPVGQYPKGIGPYGHLDLAGNVWEWCQDVWDAAAYQKPPHASGTIDPEVATGDAHLRMARGGSFNLDADWLRSAFRGRYLAVDRSQYQGFRVCLAPPSTGGSGGKAP